MNEEIRSFIAIELPNEVKSQIESYVSELRKIAPNLKWVKKESLHITLKFLGNQPPHTIENVIASLIPLKEYGKSFEIQIKNIGAFPNQNKPRVIWLGIEASPRELFFQTYAWIEEQLEQLGFEKEKRKFSPHLTLARIKFPTDLKGLWGFTENQPFPVQSFKVTEIVLMRSILKSFGAEYHQIQKY
ncbi:MAG: RNA 2',3'-cyclic phosphodiesterase, partial [Calditrichaceae bacterium]|nr:RNA 2',3'-cyclic phosphodiesterase [Calditrichaceae bacterium]